MIFHHNEGYYHSMKHNKYAIRENRLNLKEIKILNTCIVRLRIVMFSFAQHSSHRPSWHAIEMDRQ